MNIYTIYTQDNQEDSDPIIIKQGFSLIAAIFNIFWAVYHRMWLMAAITLGASAIPMLFQGNETYSVISSVCKIAIGITFGFMATEMREYTASARGFELTDIVSARNEAEAEMKFFERCHIGE